MGVSRLVARGSLVAMGGSIYLLTQPARAFFFFFFPFVSWFSRPLDTSSLSLPNFTSDGYTLTHYSSLTSISLPQHFFESSSTIILRVFVFTLWWFDLHLCLCVGCRLAYVLIGQIGLQTASKLMTRSWQEIRWFPACIARHQIVRPTQHQTAGGFIRLRPFCRVRQFQLALLHKDTRDSIGELLLHLPFPEKKGHFLWLVRVCSILGIFGESVTVECLKGWRGILLMFGPSLDFMFPLDFDFKDLLYLFDRHYII